MTATRRRRRPDHLHLLRAAARALADRPAEAPNRLAVLQIHLYLLARDQDRAARRDPGREGGVS